jgi:hypothetical protein
VRELREVSVLPKPYDLHVWHVNSARQFKELCTGVVKHSIWQPIGTYSFSWNVFYHLAHSITFLWKMALWTVPKPPDPSGNSVLISNVVGSVNKLAGWKSPNACKGRSIDR